VQRLKKTYVQVVLPSNFRVKGFESGKISCHLEEKKATGSKALAVKLEAHAFTWEALATGFKALAMGWKMHALEWQPAMK